MRDRERERDIKNKKRLNEREGGSNFSNNRK